MKHLPARNRQPRNQRVGLQIDPTSHHDPRAQRAHHRGAGNAPIEPTFAIRPVSLASRRRRSLASAGWVAFLITALLALLAASFHSELSARLAQWLSPTQLPTTLGARLPEAASPNPIFTENALPGTTSWIVPASAISVDAIQAYASAPSVAAQDTLTFFVSVRDPGTTYTATIYRLGWYGGDGARQLLQVHETGHAQGYYDEVTTQLVGCSTCVIDPSTHDVQANWAPSFSIEIPSAWVSGVYLAEFRTDDTHRVTEVSFVVRGNTTAPYAVVTPDTTAAAYNTWGGYSLYVGPDFGYASRATAVSLDRPQVPFGGFSWQVHESMPYDQGLTTYIDAVRWLERNGYDVTYLSDIDLDQAPQLALTHKVVLSVGHDEYWSVAMRDAFQHARDAGVSLLFLGANAVFWDIRFASNRAGQADHIIICSKSDVDTDYGSGGSAATDEWRSSAVGQPENSLIGIMYSGFTRSGNGFPWVVASDAHSPFLDGTGLVPGKAYGCDLVGYEWDRIYQNGATPKTLVTLASSPVINTQQQQDVSNTSYYYAPSGALIFASGSIYWDRALDTFRLFPSGACRPQDDLVPGIQLLLQHVLAAAVAAR